MFLAKTLMGAALLLAPACGVEQRTLGEACIKDEECLSQVCSDQVCVAASPLLDAEPPGAESGGPPPDAAVDRARPPNDAAADAHDASRADASRDASDAAKEAAPDHGAGDGTTTKDAKGAGG